MSNNSKKELDPEEKKTMIIMTVLLVIFIIGIMYSVLTGLNQTCKGSIITLLFFIPLVLVGYWRMGERKKGYYIYYWYFMVVFVSYMIIRMIHENCFGG